MTEHDLLFKSQYGFRHKHSCEHGVTKLVGEIYKGMENNKHTMAIFIDLSKAFDTVSHDLLLKKLLLYGIHGLALNWFSSNLSNSSMQVKCSKSTSSTVQYFNTHKVKIGTPQGSCLGPLLFLIFCNHIYLNLHLCNGILFADDTTIYKSHGHLEYLQWSIIHDMTILLDWFKANHLSMNANKTVGKFFSKNKQINIYTIKIDNISIKFVEHTKFLGIWLDRKLTLNEHISRVVQKLCKSLNLLRLGKNFLNIHTKRLIYFSQIQSHLTYGLSVWGNMSSITALSKLKKLQNKCITLINSQAANKENYKKLGILSLDQLIKLENCKFADKLLHHEFPVHLVELAYCDQTGKSLKKKHRYNTRNKNLLNKPLAKNKHYKRCIIYKGTSCLEPLKAETKLKTNLQSFVTSNKKSLLQR